MRAATPPPPATTRATGGGIAPTLGGMVAQGMALGTGSALAHSAIHALLGGRSAASGEPATPTDLRTAAGALESEGGPCKNASRAFAACMDDQGDDLEACRYWLESLKVCARAEMGG